MQVAVLSSELDDLDFGYCGSFGGFTTRHSREDDGSGCSWEE